MRIAQVMLKPVEVILEYILYIAKVHLLVLWMNSLSLQILMDK